MLKTTLGGLEFEAGQLVKVGMVRYNYMDGNGLLTLVRELGEHLSRHTSLLEAMEWGGLRRGPGTSWCDACPICHGLKEPNGDFISSAVGHEADCRLAIVLGRETRDVE